MADVLRQIGPPTLHVALPLPAPAATPGSTASRRSSAAPCSSCRSTRRPARCSTAPIRPTPAARTNGSEPAPASAARKIVRSTAREPLARGPVSGRRGPTESAMLTFQQIILRLQDYWDKQGCALLQPYDMEVGAGTSHTATFLRALGPEPWKAAYVQPSRRPKDGRYGENPNRLQHYYQYQVVLKPAPANILELYLGSLEALGFDLKKNDVRFVEDDWENPTLGCWGLGWEVWLNGMEVTQFTYFQQVGGIDCKPITGEITYGLERLAMYIQGKESLFDLEWTPGVTYRDVFHQNEVEQSTYNFEHSDVDVPAARVRRAREDVQAPDGPPARAAGLRAAAQGRPQLQPAGRARRDQRHRTRRLHRPHPQPGARRRAELPREPRAPRLPDGAEGLGRRGRSPRSTRRSRRPEHERARHQEPPRRTGLRGTAAEGAEEAGRVVRRDAGREPAWRRASSARTRSSTAFASPRRLGVHVAGRRREGRRPRAAAEADARGRRVRQGRQRLARAAEEARVAGLRPRGRARPEAPAGRQGREPVRRPGRAPARRWPKACRRRSTRRWPSCRSPR